MAAHDTHGSGIWSSGMTFSWSHTFAASSKALIFVGFKFGSVTSISGITISGGGGAVTLKEANADGGDANNIEVWECTSPESGTQTIEVTFTGDPPGKAAGISVSVTATGSFGTAVESGPTSSTTPSLTIPSLGASDLPYGGVYVNIHTDDIAPNDTAVHEILDGDNTLSVQRQATGGDGVLNWTMGGAETWITVGARAIDGSSPVTIAPSVGSAPVTGHALSPGRGINMPDQAMSITGKLIELVEIRNTGQILIAPA